MWAYLYGIYDTAHNIDIHVDYKDKTSRTHDIRIRNHEIMSLNSCCCKFRSKKNFLGPGNALRIQSALHFVHTVNKNRYPILVIAECIETIKAIEK